jgi:hypothetical protein
VVEVTEPGTSIRDPGAEVLKLDEAAADFAPGEVKIPVEVAGAATRG